MGYIVLITGAFNVVHAGHIDLFLWAKQFGHVVVALKTDTYMQGEYGENTIPLVNRVSVLRQLKCVDEVIVLPNDDTEALIRKLQPDYYVKGPDYVDHGISKSEALVCEEVGTRVLYHRVGLRHDEEKIMKSLPKGALKPIDHLD